VQSCILKTASTASARSVNRKKENAASGKEGDSLSFLLSSWYRGKGKMSNRKSRTEGKIGADFSILPEMSHRFSGSEQKNRKIKQNDWKDS
jgi:hypothetical protein